ncbi:MAG TPA: histidinol-phosphate transaminase [Methanocorpusculum sp.]|nr:histidinol-phosphate transaminase [Methanocorpusculum sp.]HJJ40515.1 histidinol-phosphate transaminase [Methanocorpusculum sp.]HJJ49656.1 histidinol-phosphate transaminase [Methanocorpusculum sp.]HJJ57594.1 histidinol-phosphate transaminase [Methanocorpusculum sp.]
MIGFPKKAVHGGRIQEIRRLCSKDILDVSASLNPYTPAVDCTFSMDDLGNYPDDSYVCLKEKIGSVFHRNPAEICVGNGSVELIRTYCAVIGGTTCRIDMPTFGEYGLAAQLAEKQIVSNTKADIRILCNPNNPTGILLRRDEILRILESETQLFVDEAFMMLARKNESVADRRDDNLFVLRSLTKSFSVPGIRFGFGFGPEDLIEKIETARAPWSVNSFAEKYAIAALDHLAELEQAREKITLERERMMRKLSDIALSWYPSEVNYLTIRLPEKAADVAERLLKKGILVRDCTSFGLDTCIRIAVMTKEIDDRVLDALADVIRKE